MSLERFIFCPCRHALDAHTTTGCASCMCPKAARQVIDALLDIEREAIRHAWIAGAREQQADRLQQGIAVPRRER